MYNKKLYIDAHFSIFLILIFGLFGKGISILNGPSSGKDHYNCNYTGGTLRCNCFTENDSEIFLIDSAFLGSRANNLPRILIEHCKTVQFAANSIKNLSNLRDLKLSNIQNVILDGSSLSWNPYGDKEFQLDQREVPKVKITIEKSTLKTISTLTFRGYINEIIFDGVTIENIEQFAFSALKQTDSIVFQKSVIKNVIPQAFKKIAINYLTMLETRWEMLPSRAFSDIRINKQLKIYRCVFETIKSSAVIAENLEKFEMTESRVNLFEGEGFKVTTRGSVTFKNNVFDDTKSGAFFGFNKLKGDLNLIKEAFIFENNTLNHGAKDAIKINVTSFDPKFSNILINETCDCKEIDSWWKDDEWFEEIHCFRDQVPSSSTLRVSEFRKYNCTILKSYATVFIVVGVVCGLIVIIGTVLIIYLRRLYQQKKQSEYDTKHSKQNISLIVPDGRTYRETELHVIVERADILTTDL